MTVLPSLTARNLGVILTDYPAPPTSLLWPNPADLPSATSAGLPVQLALGWTPSLCYKTAAAYPECCSAPCFQSAQIVPCDTPPPPWPPLASCCGLHQIQDDNTGLQGRQWNCAHLPPNTGETTRHPARALGSTTSAGRLVPPSLTANKARSADRRITRHLPQKTQDSLVLSSPRPHMPCLPPFRSLSSLNIDLSPKNNDVVMGSERYTTTIWAFKVTVYRFRGTATAIKTNLFSFDFHIRHHAKSLGPTGGSAHTREEKISKSNIANIKSTSS